MFFSLDSTRGQRRFQAFSLQTRLHPQQSIISGQLKQFGKEILITHFYASTRLLPPYSREEALADMLLSIRPSVELKTNFFSMDPGYRCSGEK